MTAQSTTEPGASDIIPDRNRATAIGVIAILMWSTLALLTTGTAGLPPFQVLGLTFAVAFVLSMVLFAATNRLNAALLRAPLAAWAIGVGGLFGSHLLYFIALKNAPPAEAGLIGYLWPLLIVLLSALLPGGVLRARTLIAAACGLFGTALLITNGNATGFQPAHLWGYLAALAFALTWAGYSVLNRTQGQVATETLGPICGLVALLGFAVHASTELWVTPDLWQWLSLIGLGLGPVGLAFFVWDYGTKHGDLSLLGVLAYAAPVLSTLLLVLAGRADPSWTLAVACTLIVGGAVLASFQGR
jgi:drug/metabolite transporter (DMT)-like permease